MNVTKENKMNATNANTAKALRALAPAAVKVDGRSYTHSGCLYSDEDNVVHWDYSARKQRGAVLASKLRVSATYNAGLDLYTIEIVHFDGLTFEDVVVRYWPNSTFEAFTSIGQVPLSAK